MGNPLRDRRPLAELAARGQVIEIADKIGSFERLAAIVENDLSALEPDRLPRDWRDSLVTGQLSFGFLDAQQRLAALEGQAELVLDAVCQRCLEPFRYRLSASLRLLPVCDGNTTDGSDGYEVWELDDETICPAEVVEEALIMAMPLSAMHDEGDKCRNYDAAGPGSPQTTRPFAALKAQLDENR